VLHEHITKKERTMVTRVGGACLQVYGLASTPELEKMSRDLEEEKTFLLQLLMP